MGTTYYSKHFIPLESNPELFSKLMQQLGGSSSLSFVDVFSIDDPDLIACVRRPVIALLLTFPTTRLYEEDKKSEEDGLKATSPKELPSDILWFKQTINNACGLYGLLHAVCSSEARSFLVPGSFLHKLIEESTPLSVNERALLLENSDFLEETYRNIAIQGDSTVPEDAEEEVDYHYICFVSSSESNHVYELDGDRLGPVDRGTIIAQDEDLLGQGMLAHIRAFMQRYQHENMSFNLMALVVSDDA